MFRVAMGLRLLFFIRCGLNTHARQHCHKITDDTISVAIIAGSKTSPEAPTNAFEDALTSHVLAPLLRAMITIAVAFDSEPSTIGAFDDHIDAIPQRTDLRTHAVSQLQQSSHHVTLEFGITQGERIGAHFDLRHRILKMSDETRFKIVRIEFFAANGPYEDDAIARPRDRHVKSLLIAQHRECRLV